MTDVKAPLPLAAQGKIFHYALLAASEGGEFKAETANRINKRMRELRKGSPAANGATSARPATPPSRSPARPR